MALSDAEKAFKEAANHLRKREDTGLWHMNEGFLQLCSGLREIERRLGDVDHKIVYLLK